MRSLKRTTLRSGESRIWFRSVPMSFNVLHTNMKRTMSQMFFAPSCPGGCSTIFSQARLQPDTGGKR